jgi:hypothetical protein
MAAKKSTPVAEEEVVVVQEPQGYDINRLFNATGATKNPTLSELNSSALMTKQGLEPCASANTARDVVRTILNRAGLVESPQKRQLEDYFTEAMNFYITNPAAWQNPQGSYANSE